MNKFSSILSFLIEVSRLKSIERTGWVWRGLKNPETIAEHSFRLGFFAWTLSFQSGLQTRKLMEMALLHDVCETYAGDLTPYYGIIPKNPASRKRMLLRWIRTSQNQKKALADKRFALEKKALEKLIKHLPSDLGRSLFGNWFEFEKSVSQEGRFVKQIDKIEAMLQAIEYFGTGPGTMVVGWWEEVEELVDHPLLKEFLKSIQRRLYERKSSRMDGELQFLMDVGKLKRKPKKSWVLRKVKNPDSLANHTFFLALMVWLLGKERKEKSFSQDRAIKMAFLSYLPYALAQERSSYDSLLNNAASDHKRKETLRKWVRFSLAEKKKMFFEKYKAEKSALRKLLRYLPESLSKDMMGVWEEFKANQTKEARFVNQIRVMELLLQALLYWSHDKKFPIKPWWEWAFEHSDSDVNIEFMEALKKEFLPGNEQ